MTWLYFAQFRHALRAARLGDRAAGMETAAGGRVDRRRDFPFQDYPLASFLDQWVGDRHRRKQGRV